MSTAAFTTRVQAQRQGRKALPSRAVAARAAAPPTRRTALVVGVAGAAALIAPRSAEAFLGIGEDAGKIYTDATAKLLADTNKVIAMEGDKEEAVKELKLEMNAWTSKYRRDGNVGGRPSFSNMYSAVNALAGHWNSFGADAPIPKKRFARIQKELEDVDKLLARGR